MEFPNLGEHCAQPECNILDFLPFTCNLCKKVYCVDHHKYDAHTCPESHTIDVKIPICPLCNKPVPNKPGQTPDISVNQHLENGCRSSNKTMVKDNTYKCSEKHCKAKEIITVKCDKCGFNFCLRHRHTTDHNCVGPVEAKRTRTLNGSIFKNWLKPTHQEAKSAPTQAIQRGLQVSHSGNVNHLSKLQGNMSEEQAMQAALTASRGGGQPTPPEDDDLSVAIARSLADLEMKPNKSQQKSKDCVVS